MSTCTNANLNAIKDASDDASKATYPAPTDCVTTLAITLTIVEGDGLAAKDRDMFGHWTTSDPYAVVSFFPSGLRGPEIKLGQTNVVRHTLSPKWHDLFEVEIWEQRVTQDAQFRVVLIDWDEELLPGMNPAEDDFMGVVDVHIAPILSTRSKSATKYYGVPKASASRASGRIQCAMEIKTCLKKYGEIPQPTIKVPTAKPILAIQNPNYANSSTPDLRAGLKKTGSKLNMFAASATSSNSSNDLRAGLKKSGSKLSLFGMAKKINPKAAASSRSLMAAVDSAAAQSHPKHPLVIRPVGSLTALVDPNDTTTKPPPVCDGKQSAQLTQILAKRTLTREALKQQAEAEAARRELEILGIQLKECESVPSQNSITCLDHIHSQEETPQDQYPESAEQTPPLDTGRSLVRASSQRIMGRATRPGMRHSRSFKIPQTQNHETFLQDSPHHLLTRNSFRNHPRTATSTDPPPPIRINSITQPPPQPDREPSVRKSKRTTNNNNNGEGSTRQRTYHNDDDNRKSNERQPLLPKRQFSRKDKGDGSGRPNLARSSSRRTSMRSVLVEDVLTNDTNPAPNRKSSHHRNPRGQEEEKEVEPTSTTLPLEPPPEDGFYIDADGVEYYILNGVEYYKGPLDGQYYAEEPLLAPAGAAAGAEPTPDDEPGFYADANGVEYFLDKNGKEHYPTDAIPDNADFGFFEDEYGVVYFVDEDGLEHYRNDPVEQQQQQVPQLACPPNPKDESGFYLDADGHQYFLDKDGIEYYQNPKDGGWYAHGNQNCEEGQKCWTLPMPGNTKDDNNNKDNNSMDRLKQLAGEQPAVTAR